MPCDGTHNVIVDQQVWRQQQNRIGRIAHLKRVVQKLFARRHEKSRQIRTGDVERPGQKALRKCVLSIFRIAKADFITEEDAVGTKHGLTHETEAGHDKPNRSDGVGGAYTFHVANLRRFSHPARHFLNCPP